MPLDHSAALEVSELWHEYEQGTSATAQLVKDFDKLEMIIQVRECLIRPATRIYFEDHT